MWNRDLLDQPEAYAEALDRWLAYYRELGIEQLGYACLVLRKRTDGRDGWLEAQLLPRAALRPAGRHVRRLFETHDRLATSIRRAAPRPAPARRRRCRRGPGGAFADGRWQQEGVTLRLESGLPFSAELDPPTARLVRALDGSRTLRDALAEAVEDDEAREAGLGVARAMLEVGFLELVD